MGGYKFPSWLKTGSPNREFKGDYGWDYEGHLRDVKDYVPNPIKPNIPDLKSLLPFNPIPARKDRGMSSNTEGVYVPELINPLQARKDKNMSSAAEGVFPQAPAIPSRKGNNSSSADGVHVYEPIDPLRARKEKNMSSAADIEKQLAANTVEAYKPPIKKPQLKPIDPRSMLEQIKTPVSNVADYPKKASMLSDIHRQTGADKVPHVKVEENYQEPGWGKTVLNALGSGFSSLGSSFLKVGEMEGNGTLNQAQQIWEAQKKHTEKHHPENDTSYFDNKIAEIKKITSIADLEAERIRLTKKLQEDGNNQEVIKRLAEVEKVLEENRKDNPYYKIKDMADNATDYYNKNLENLSGAKSAVSNIIGSVPQLSTALINPSLFFTSAYGSYGNDAAKEGATPEQQKAYGYVGGGAELLTEAIPLKLLKNTVAGKYINKEANTLLGKYGKQILRTAGGTAAEAAQEAITSPIMQTAKKNTYDSSMPLYDQVDENGNVIPGILSKSNLKNDISGGAGLYLLMSALGLGVNKLNKPNTQIPNKSINFANQAKVNTEAPTVNSNVTSFDRIDELKSKRENLQIELNKAFESNNYAAATNLAQSINSITGEIEKLKDAKKPAVDIRDLILRSGGTNEVSQTVNKTNSIMDQTKPKVEEVKSVKPAEVLESLKPKAPKIDVMTHDFSKVEDVATLENSIKELEDAVKNTPDTPENKSRMIQMNLQLFAAKSKLKKLSKFKSNTISRSLDLTDQEKSMIPDYEFDYIPETSKEWAEKAAENVANDLEGTMRKIENSNSISGGTEAHEAAIISMKLKEEAMQTGDYSKFKKFLKTVATKTRETARALKGTDTAWKKKTADGAIMDAQRAVDNAEEIIKKKNPKLIEKVNKEAKSLIDKIKAEGGTVDAEAIRDRVKKDYGIPVLTDEDIKSIQNHMDRAQNLQEGSYAQRVEYAKVSQIISDKQLVTNTEKLQAWHRIAMLLNPKTLITRNPMGNIILGAAENIKDIPGSAIDKLVSLGTGKRTTGLPEYLVARKGQGKGMVTGVTEWTKDIKNRVDTSPSLGQMELPHKRIFKNRTLNAIEQLTSRGLQLGDRPFYQAAYDARLQELMKLNKVKLPTQEMIEDATATALEKTLQNDTTLSKSAKMAQKALNGGKDFGFGNIVMPFTKTPANILDKIIDYSPGGLVKALAETAKLRKGTFNQKKFVDSVSRGLTGTGLIALGYAMAKNGLVTGDLDKDKDVANLEKQMGKQAYSFKIGDKYVTFDWAQPSSVPLAIGADFYTAGKSKKDFMSSVLAGFEGGANTLFKQSFLQGIQRMMSGYSPAAGVGSTLLNAPNSFMPNGGRQINQLIDPFNRETYDPNGKQQFLNTLKTKIPGMSKSLLPRVDSLGNDSKAFDGNNSIFNVLLNPGYISKNKATTETDMVTDLYKKTGLKTHFPRIVPKKLDYQKDKYSEKVTINLTPQEYYNFQKEVGQKYKQLLQIKASSYDSKISNRLAVDKVSELEKELSKIYNEARMKILKSRGIVK